MHRAIKSALMFRPHVSGEHRNEEQKARATLADPHAPATLRQQAQNTLSSWRTRTRMPAARYLKEDNP